MNYNINEQRPYFYQVRQYNASDIEGLMDYIEDNCPNQKLQFESVKYNPYDYMYKRLYDKIADEIEKREIFELILEFSPLRKIFGNYNWCLIGLPSLNLDWIKSNSKYEFNVLNNTEANYRKICYLFFCETEHDFWDYFSFGYGDIKEMYDYYKDEEDCLYKESTLEIEKSREFLLYVYDKTLDFEKETSSKKITKGITDKERKERVSLITRARERVLKLLLKEFDLSDYHDAQKAWDTGIIEIRQEFVREKNLQMLRKIINNNC